MNMKICDEAAEKRTKILSVKEFQFDNAAVLRYWSSTR
jgi:hypothetical protein